MCDVCLLENISIYDVYFYKVKEFSSMHILMEKSSY